MKIKPINHKKMKKRGQAESIVIFFALMVAIFIVSMIVMRVTNSILTPFQAQMGNVSTQSGEAVGYVHTQFATWWDYLIVLMFMFNVVILLISAFMVDIHPAFLILYIFTIFFLFIFGNYVLGALDNIWLQVGTPTETAQSPLQQFILNNFQAIMMGVVILSGIVMYSKFRFGQGTGSGGAY